MHHDHHQFLMTHSRPVLSVEEEREAFLQLAEAAREAERLGALERRSRSQAARLSLARRKRDQITDHIVRANFGLVISMAQRTKARNVEWDDLISEGLTILHRSVAQFDVNRQVKFSTYVCRALINGFCRMGIVRGKKTSRCVADSEVLNHQAHRLTAPSIDPEVERAELRELLEHLMAELSEEEEAILKARFGWDGGPSQKLHELGRTLELSKERVRQIQNNALAKLRLLLDTYGPPQDPWAARLVRLFGEGMAGEDDG